MVEICGAVPVSYAFCVLIRQHKAAFTEAEETQLKALFSLDNEGLDTILQGCAYVFEQCAYTGANEALLASQLTDVGMAAPQV